MKQHILYLMCGCPGSGKSTWAAKNVGPGDVIISRDQIRFDMLNDGEAYFCKENAVFKEFVRMIQDNLNNDRVRNVFCDATHITKASRDKLLNALDLSNVEQVIVIVVRPSLTETLRRNDERDGLARVPRSVVRRMWMQFERPEEDEGRVFDTYYAEVPDGQKDLVDF